MKRNFTKGFKKGFKNFGREISTIVNSILLIIVYIFGVGLTSIFAKVLGKKFLSSKLLKGGTYWTNFPQTNKKIEEYLRQF